MNGVLATILVLHGGAGWADELICLGLPLLLFLLISTSVGRRRGARAADTDDTGGEAAPKHSGEQPAADVAEESER